jgi:hypothetical protein
LMGRNVFLKFRVNHLRRGSLLSDARATPAASGPFLRLRKTGPFGVNTLKRTTPPERNGRMAMRYLKLAILVLAYALISPAFAQTCCPAGCAPEGNRCVTTGPLWTRCIPVACAEGSQKPSAVSSGPSREHRKGAGPLRTARTYMAPRQIPPQCPLMNPTKAQVDEATHQCVNALTGSAQLRSCFFEDDIGRAEDKRTGLSCPDRQAALAKQCVTRCANYASDTTHLVCTGSYPNTVWHISFGDISGDTGDSARVERCGPRLRSIFVKKPPSG